MWLMTKVGFFSVVQKPGDGSRLTIRARVRDDLVRLKECYLPKLSRITDSDDTDYQFRASADRKDFARAAAKIASEIDYPNFKDAVMKEQGHQRSAVYHRVWADLLALEVNRPPLKLKAAANAG